MGFQTLDVEVDGEVGGMPPFPFEAVTDSESEAASDSDDGGACGEPNLKIKARPGA